VIQIEIYFKDLKENKQKEFLEALKIKEPEEMNWDAFPLAIYETIEGEED